LLLLIAMQRRVFLPVLALSLLLFLPSLHGKDDFKYLSDDSPDVIALLPDPPAAGSAEAAADLATTRAVSRARTPEQAAKVAAGADLTLFSFSPAIGSWFEPGRFPQTEAFIKRVLADTRTATSAGKTHFQRPRPYTVDPAIVPVAEDKSFSYPSGHATRGTVLALILAELFPANREALLRLGRDAGWDRIVAGVHYPSDIFAGRVLGQAIVHQMLRNPRFLQDLAEARAELAARRPQPAAAAAAGR
jgi:acid phosphatase (class A)